MRVHVANDVVYSDFNFDTCTSSVLSMLAKGVNEICWRASGIGVESCGWLLSCFCYSGRWSSGVSGVLLVVWKELAEDTKKNPKSVDTKSGYKIVSTEMVE